MRFHLSLVAAIFLSSCAAPIGRLNPGAPFPYEIVSDHTMTTKLDATGYRRPSVNVSTFYERGALDTPLASSTWVVTGYCAREAIYELHAGAARWTCAHEVAHLADRLGSYRAAIGAVTPPHPNEEMAARLAVLEEIDVAGPDYWQTIFKRWGHEALGGHPNLIERLDP